MIAEKYGHLMAIMWLKLAAMFTTHFPVNGKSIPPIKMVMFLGDGTFMAASLNHIIANKCQHYDHFFSEKWETPTISNRIPLGPLVTEIQVSTFLGVRGHFHGVSLT